MTLAEAQDAVRACQAEYERNGTDHNALQLACAQVAVLTLAMHVVDKVVAGLVARMDAVERKLNQ